ncbi:MAG: hypothetical protein LBQ60_17385 [Bacteroidales bacterium]|nr:hypothetical protein [Bacteroidales bacterium]
MEGIILFADDNVFDSDRLENKLFHKFNSNGYFSILPINNLTILEKTVSSISTYKALILDWNFKRFVDDEDFEDIEVEDETPLEFLRKNKLYSLIYIYSQDLIPQDIQDELNALYPNKIFFEKKNATNETEKEYNKIIAGINKFQEENTHLEVPFVWSQAINQSAQVIFSELEKADPNWIREIYQTAQTDGAEPSIEVINVFHNLLNESIVQNDILSRVLSEYTESSNVRNPTSELSLAKLYNRIYYTKLLDTAPFMTGDIFKFSEEDFAILFTPECDVSSKQDKALEFLVFRKNNFNDFLSDKKQYSKDQYSQMINKQKQSKDLTSQFNNGNMAFHILPSFPFDETSYNMSAFIDFESAFVVKDTDFFKDKRSQYKLNSPYIYQLRQRYIAYIGRVGVPAIPQSLRLYNLK